MFGFEPMVAAYNILDLARPLLVIAGFIAMLAFLFRGQVLNSLATLFVVALLYFAFQPGILENLGASTAKMLTIETGITDSSEPGADTIPEQTPSDNEDDQPDTQTPDETPDSLFE